MTTIYLEPNDPAAHPAIDMMKRAFPSYAGKKFKVRVQETVNVRSYWDGGSREYFAFVNLADGRTTETVHAQSAFDRPIPGADAVTLPDGIACVVHSIFCGTDTGLTLILSPANAPRFLPETIELSELESLVLIATVSLKNSYGGESDIRFKRVREYLASEWRDGVRVDTGRRLTKDEWTTAQSALIGRKLLTAAGAITPSGRNAVANHPLRNRIN